MSAAKPLPTKRRKTMTRPAITCGTRAGARVPSLESSEVELDPELHHARAEHGRRIAPRGAVPADDFLDGVVVQDVEEVELRQHAHRPGAERSRQAEVD